MASKGGRRLSPCAKHFTLKTDGKYRCNFCEFSLGKRFVAARARRHLSCNALYTKGVVGKCSEACPLEVRKEYSDLLALEKSAALKRKAEETVCAAEKANNHKRQCPVQHQWCLARHDQGLTPQHPCALCICTSCCRCYLDGLLFCGCVLFYT